MKSGILGIALVLGIMPLAGYAQQKIGGAVGAADANAYLQLGDAAGANKGLLLPRVALTTTSAAGPLTAHVAGMVVYNTATAGSGTTAVTPGYYYNDGTKWVRIVATSDFAAKAWIPGGNTNGSLQAIGTNDNFDLPFETNGTEKMRLDINGNLGLGTTAPGNRLTVNGGKFQYTDGTQGAGKVLVSDTNGVSSWQPEGANIAGQNVTAGSSKVALGGTPTGAALKPFSIDVNEANININNLSGPLSLNKIAGGGAATDQILTWNGSTWAPASTLLVYLGNIGAGVNISSTLAANTWLYTGTTLTLPPGKWLVNVTMLLTKCTPSIVFTGIDEAWWVRSTFCDGSASFSQSSDIISSDKWVSGLLPPSSPYALMTGPVIINNTSGANKTYYYWGGNTTPHNATGNVIGFGGGWVENIITAQRIN